ncbi:cytochrome C assembly family protein [Vibrio ulleungensis]|uniref:Cytochrome c biogenesis protein CcsA n=1 Tax=Vibrio ulleungensis TaxID=2807619 RepID=A0ABS2HMG6_9VIBR|nr:cytochrome c biogenesis protein CcsA [Vibrio ulleungensis]MBM7037866.1 cytochrome c biogenesis protein CcsA [Vibrio ulleungensis]
MDALLVILAIVAYSLAMAVILPGLLHKKGIPMSKALTLSGVGLLAHGALTASLIFEGQGQNLGLLNVTLLVSFIISCALTITIPKTKLWFLLPIAYGFSILNLIAATWLPVDYITHLEGRIGIVFHVSMALFSYATLTIAALYALQMAWLDYKLKHKNSQALNPNLPPLLKVERQLFNLILVGTGLLSVTLVTGLLFVPDIFASGKGHKILFSFAAWIIYSVLIWGHFKQGWRGNKVTWMTLIGAICLTLGYFGSRFVREVLLT